MESNNKDSKNKDSKNKKNVSHSLVKISKTMSALLRHQAEKYNLEIDKAGFVKLEDLLKTTPFKKLKADKDQILEVVKKDEKGRYEVVDKPPLYIRAVQGHSLKSVQDEDLFDPIQNIFEYPIIVHGTYYEAWEFIKKTGLNRMSRNSIHFGIGYPNQDHVKSGMRMDCEVYIEINPITTTYNDIKLFISKNHVVLTPGIDGILPMEYVKKVVDKKGKLLYAQKFDLGIFLDFDNDGLLGYIVVDITDQKIIFQSEDQKIPTFDELAELLIEKELVKKPLIVVIDKNREKDYICLIKNKIEYIKYISIFSDYIPKAFSNDLSINDKESIAKDM
jgi:2'-phosphotransferase